MLLLSGALVSGPYALITTAVSADLVSGCASRRGAQGWLWRAPLTRDSDCLCE